MCAEKIRSLQIMLITKHEENITQNLFNTFKIVGKTIVMQNVPKN